MFDGEPFYDSDEGVASGPITFKEVKARLKDKNYNNPNKNRRETAFGCLERILPSNESNSTEYFTAGTSGQTNKMASDSSLEDANGSVKEAVDNILRTLDNEQPTHEIIEISDEEVYQLSDDEKSEIMYISSTSSPDDVQSNLFLSPPKLKINSTTLHQSRQQSILSASNSSLANVAKLSDTEILQDLSALHLSPRGTAVHTVDESFLLQSTSEKDAADDEDDEELNETKLVSIETNSAEFSGKQLLKGDGLPSVLADKNDEHHNDEELMVFDEHNDNLNNTLDRIDFILNSCNLEEAQDCITPQRTPPVTAVKTAQNTPNLASNSSNGKRVSPFKVPAKIPRSLRKNEFITTRSRFDNIKSPVAHYIKNSPYAPIIQNQPCGVLTHEQLLVLLETPLSKPKIQWPKICLPEKIYNRAEVQIVPDYNRGKILKIPANIAAITIDMGVMKRHLGRQEISRLPIPFPISDNAEFHDTLTAQSMNSGDVSLISQHKIIIE